MKGSPKSSLRPFLHRALQISTTHEVVLQILQKSLRQVKEVWKNADGTTIFDLKRTLYLNLFLMCASGCVFIFFHCLMCYLLHTCFPIFCSRVLVSLCCIFS